jgi:putative autotransporter adhesin-like protein
MNTIPIRPFVALKFLTLAALSLVLLLLNGCHWVGIRGNGDIKTDTRSITDFSKLEADGAFEVNWTAGPAALSITTDENLLEYMRTRVSGDRLRIEWEKPLKGTRGIKVNIASPRLAAVTLNGAVRFVGANLSGPEFYLEANGATKVTLGGTLNAVSADMNGASRLDADRLITRAMELSISGAGRAEVHVTEALKVDISGAGKVIYSGNPKRVDKNITGAGSIKPRD